EGVTCEFRGSMGEPCQILAGWQLLMRGPYNTISTRRKGLHHPATTLPPLDPPAVNDVERAVVELTMRCTAAIEAAISEVPEQWLWAHDRWRTRPAAEGGP